LLTDYNRLFFRDYVLPAGRLRESRRGAERAHAVVVTKCPAEISDDEMMKIEKSIRGYADRPVFFTKIRYGFPQPFGNHELVSEAIILVTGIAHAQPLVDYVSANFRLIKHIAYSDHHNYSSGDIESLSRISEENPNTSILTTEKDMVKMSSRDHSRAASQLPLFYLPIETEFIKSGKDFDEMVLTQIRHGNN
jgi:tetraacyldisaccharide 4'-kinase